MKILNKGFTLSEVLLTLGVIGVVAAMVLPPVIANYRKKVYVEGYREAVSLLSNAFRKAMAEDGADTVYNTSLWDGCSPNGTKDYLQWIDDCTNELGKYLKIRKKYSRKDLYNLGDVNFMKTEIKNERMCKRIVGKSSRWWALKDKTVCVGELNNVFVLDNGMRFDITLGNDIKNANYLYEAGWGFVDVNGYKGPNMLGRDTFYIRILPDGRVGGATSVLVSQYQFDAMHRNTEKDKKALDILVKARNHACKTAPNDDFGIGCSGLVFDTWRMDY